MMLYASEERRLELQSVVTDPIRLKLTASMMPRVYTVRSLATSPDGTRARMRATGNFTFMGSTAPTFGVIDLVREVSGWKVDKFEWTGDKPPGFDAAVAQSPRRGASASAGVEKPPAVAETAKPKPEAVPLAGEPSRPVPDLPAATSAPVVASPPPGMVQRTAPRAPCEIKPVMTDEDLINCGASPR